MQPTFKQMMNEVVQHGSCCECGARVLVCPHDVIDDVAGTAPQGAPGRSDTVARPIGFANPL